MKKKTKIELNAEQARHYWSSTAAVIENNSSLQEISLVMDGEPKKGTTKKAPKQLFIPEKVAYTETLETFLHSNMLYDATFRARYTGHPYTLDLYPHRLAWGYAFEIRESVYEQLSSHVYVEIPMVHEEIFIKTFSEIKNLLQAAWSTDIITDAWILHRVYCHFERNSPIFDGEREQIQQNFGEQYGQNTAAS